MCVGPCEQAGLSGVVACASLAHGCAGLCQKAVAWRSREGLSFIWGEAVSSPGVARTLQVMGLA